MTTAKPKPMTANTDMSPTAMTRAVPCLRLRLRFIGATSYVSIPNRGAALCKSN